MSKIPLLLGTYIAHSVIADAQHCVNLYPENNPQDAEEQVTHYPAPGLNLLKSAPTYGTGRGLYLATNGQLFAVIGTSLYTIDNLWNYNKILTLLPGTTPVSMQDNGKTLILVDGTSTGYEIPLNQSYVTGGGVSSSFIGTITTNVLTIVSMISGTMEVGQKVSGDEVLGSTTIMSQISGTPGGAGTYKLDASYATPLLGEQMSSAASASFTGSIFTNVLTVTAVASGTILPNQRITAAGIADDTFILAQTSGPIGGTGTYTVSVFQGVLSTSMTSQGEAIFYASMSGTNMTVSSLNGASFTGGIAGTTLTVTNVASGPIQINQFILGAGVAANTIIVSQLTGTTGDVGTYLINNPQAVLSEAMTTIIGALTPGQVISGYGVAANTVIVSQTSGPTGGPGVYVISPANTIAGRLMTASNIVDYIIQDSAFLGADFAQYLDTFLIFNKPNSNIFFTSLSNQVTPFDPLYFAAKTAYPDEIIAIQVIHREIWLIGRQTTEIWYDAGGQFFPFAIIPGVFIQQGCTAKYSVAQHDLNVFWLGRNKDGNAVAIMGTKYQASRISNPALEQEWQTYPTVDDAIAFTFQLGGHIFYQLTFPSADKTWVYDLSTQQWHERQWMDSNGNPHRHRANCACFAYGKVVCLDWQNGNLYALDLETYTDAGQPILRRRGFPHMVVDGNNVIYDRFIADIECGGNQDPNNTTLNLNLRWSDDRGRSYGNNIFQAFDTTGAANISAQFRKLGRARDRVFELSWSTNAKTALQGAWVEAKPSKT